VIPQFRSVAPPMVDTSDMGSNFRSRCAWIPCSNLLTDHKDTWCSAACKAKSLDELDVWIKAGAPRLRQRSAA
jgi:hypothetical protein